MTETPKRLFIIDGMAMIYRSHFAMIKNPLTTKNGQHTSAIYGLANSIFKLIKFSLAKLIRSWFLKVDASSILQGPHHVA